MQPQRSRNTSSPSLKYCTRCSPPLPLSSASPVPISPSFLLPLLYFPSSIFPSSLLPSLFPSPSLSSIPQSLPLSLPSQLSLTSPSPAPHPLSCPHLPYPESHEHTCTQDLLCMTHFVLYLTMQCNSRYIIGFYGAFFHENRFDFTLSGLAIAHPLIWLLLSPFTHPHIPHTLTPPTPSHPALTSTFSHTLTSPHTLLPPVHTYSPYILIPHTTEYQFVRSTWMVSHH